jgi:hypothetical protein
VRIVVTGAIALAAVACVARQTHVAGGATSCAATTVRYTPTAIGIPHVDAGAVKGHLFYYAGPTLMDGRVNSSDGLVIYVRGRWALGSTKIMWSLGRGAGTTLRIVGKRLDGAGRFSQRLRSSGGGDFPSIVNVPAAGCWRLSLRSGRVRASVVLRAAALPEQRTCDATPVEAGWAVARPRSSGIRGGWGPWLTAQGGALLYTHGRQPGGFNMKVPWWVRRPTEGVLALRGTRLDGSGVLAQDLPPAVAHDGPQDQDVFPSVVDVPAAGCWLLRLRVGTHAGIVVVRAVDGR